MTEYLEPADVEEWVTARGLHFRDRSLLLSALAGPMPVFGEEVYPDVHQKAAVLLIGINRNHPLLDGNKRLSWLVTAVFYELNGFDLFADRQADIDTFVRAVAADDLTRDDVIAWLAVRAHPVAGS